MTQDELDSITKKMRSKGLHSSWNELLIFSRDLVGGLLDAYQTIVNSVANSNKISSPSRSDVLPILRDKLAIILTLLTSEEQVAKWESYALSRDNSPGT